MFPRPLSEEMYAQAVKKYERVEDIVTQRLEYESDGLKVMGVRCLPKEWGSNNVIPAHAGIQQNHPDSDHNALDPRLRGDDVVESSEQEASESAHPSTSPSGRGIPILIFNRGGNRRYGMLSVLQVLKLLHPFVRMGYSVYASNYRGTDGGEGQEEFGGDDVNDIIALLELAKAQPEWDAKNVFMCGWSRGGMMSLRAIAEGAEVNAACTIAGLTNLPQVIVDRPYMKEKVYEQLIPHGSAAELEEAMRLRSAVCWPEKLRSVPLMIHHGDKDDTVAYMHGQTLAAKLAEIDHPHEFITWPGGDHFLNKEREAMLAQTDAFFRRYMN